MRRITRQLAIGVTAVATFAGIVVLATPAAAATGQYFSAHAFGFDAWHDAVVRADNSAFLAGFSQCTLVSETGDDVSAKATIYCVA